MSRKPDQRERALRAHYLYSKNIRGDELAARLKVSPDEAALLVQVGSTIATADAHRLTKREREVMKVTARVMVRRIFAGSDYAKINEIDFAAGQRSGWSGKVLVRLVALGLVVMPLPGRLYFTPAGWAFVFEARFIKPTWRGAL